MPNTCFAFTKARIEALPLPAAGRDTYRDAKTAGLILRVSATGVKTFALYRKVEGRPQRITLGRFPVVSIESARKLAQAVAGDIAKGANPIAERRARRDVPTLQQLFERWLDLHAKQHRKRWKETQSQFKYATKDLQGRRIDRITTADVAEWHGRTGTDRGQVIANRMLSLVSTLYNFAPKVGYNGPNPCRGVAKFKERSRDRFLQPQEMRAFFEAVRRQEEVWRDYFLTLLFTGARKGNVAAMRWEEVDLQGCTWRIPETKNGQVVTIALAPPVVNLLRTRQQSAGDNPWVFPGRSGHVQDSRKAWDRLLTAAGIEDLHVHDLRRSLGSWQAALGSSLAIIGASLGHRDLKSTQVYARLQLDPIRESVEKATTAMLAAANAKQPEVIDATPADTPANDGGTA